MRSKRWLLVTLVFGATVGASHALCAAPPEKVAAETKALTDTERDAFIEMAMRSGGLPGLQTVVVKNGRILRMKSYGYAVLDRPGPRRPMSNESLMLSASIPKTLVTVAVLQQMERGKLTLDDDINKYIPFSVRNPAWPEVPITLRMLLTHTSSLNEEDDDRENSTLTYGKDTEVTLEQIVDQDFAPGGARRWSGQFRPGRPGTERIYSNDGYVLAAYAVQRIVNESFDRYVAREILEPLGMRSTSYWLAGLPVARFSVTYASVRQQDGGYRFSPAQAYWGHRDAGGSVLEHQISCPDYPAGCAHTTAQDFAQLMIMLMNKGTANGVKILEPSSVVLMVTPTGFRNLDGWNQSVGLHGPLDLRGRQLWGHGGVDRGAANAFYFNPKTGVGVVAFANANDPDFSLSYAVDGIALSLMSWFE
jgi:CubicO group peptidase (beta-lactamase class C family)